MKLLFQLATYRASNQLPLAGLQSTRRQTDHRFDKVSIKCAVVEWGGGWWFGSPWIWPRTPSPLSHKIIF